MGKTKTTEDGTVKAKKGPKPAGMFRKPIADKAFQKKYLKKIGQVADRDFLASCFTLDKGKWKLRAGLEPESLKKLNVLSKAIKQNRGGVNAMYAIVFSLLIVGLAVFGIFFMNPLMEKGLELGLQAAFGARAEVDALRFDPFRMRLAVSAIHVADSAAPMTNLFETGRVEFRLNPSAALRGKIWIEEAAAESLALGTPRTASGALPGREGAEGESSGADAAAASAVPEPPLVDFANFDAMALLEAEKEKLESTKAYAAAGAAYDEASARWTARVEASRKAVEGAQAASQKALAINVGAIKTVAQATAAIEEAKRAIDAVKAVTTEAKAIGRDIQKDGESLASLTKAATGALSADIAHLKAFVGPKSGAAMSALEPTIQAMLSDKAERYLYYGRRGLALLADIRASLGAKKAEDPQKAAERAAEEARAARLKGRDVRFPSRAYPAFRLSRLVSQFPVAGQEWSVELKEVSSDPDLVGAPTTLTVGAKGGAFGLDLFSQADFRTEAESLYRVDASLSGIALDLKDALAKAGLGGFSGSLDGKLGLEGPSEEAFSAALGLKIQSPKVAAPAGTLGTAVAQAIVETGMVEADATWKDEGTDADPAFGLKTNLDDIVARAVTAMAKQYAAKAMAEVEKALRDYVSRELEGKLGSKEEFDALFALAKGDEKAVDTLKASLDKRLAELEAKAKAAATGAATDAASGLLGGVSLPKLP